MAIHHLEDKYPGADPRFAASPINTETYAIKRRGVVGNENWARVLDVFGDLAKGGKKLNDEEREAVEAICAELRLALPPHAVPPTPDIERTIRHALLKGEVLLQEVRLGVAPPAPPVDAVPTKIDPNNMWDSAVRKNWADIKDGGDPVILPAVDVTTGPDKDRRTERYFLSYALTTLKNAFWRDPSHPTLEDQEKKGSVVVTSLPVGSTESGVEITIGKMIDYHPGTTDADAPGREIKMREEMKLLEKIMQGGLAFDELASRDNSHEEWRKHMAKYVFSGHDWQVLVDLPAMEEGGMPIGEAAMEALGVFASWNDLYIKTTPTERTAIATEVNNHLGVGPMLAANPNRVPTENDLKRASELFKRSASVGSPNYSEIDFLAKGEGGDDYPTIVAPTFSLTDHATGRALAKQYSWKMDSKQILFLYETAAQRRYDRFLELYSIQVQRQVVQSLEKTRQTKYGVFPRRHYGDIVVDGMTNIDRWLPQISIQVGCYYLGLGEYDPINQILTEAATGAVRPLTPDERDDALKKGRIPTILGFHTYQANGGPIGDDNVSRKSSITAVRLYETAGYRENYASTGREGKFNQRFYKHLMVNPLDYEAADQTSIRRLAGGMLSRELDLAQRAMLRDQRRVANYEAMSTTMLHQHEEAYGFAESLYKAMSGGLDDAIQGFNINALVKLEQVKTLLDPTEFLVIDDNMLQSLKRFVSQKIGYYVDRYTFTGTPADFANAGFYDSGSWQIVATLPSGKNVYSPLLTMLNLTTQDRTRIAAMIARPIGEGGGFKNAVTKAILTPMLIETLMTTGTPEIQPYFLQGLKFILAKTEPERRYRIKDRASLVSALSSAEEGILFNYDPEEVDSMFVAAGKVARSWVTVLVESQKGL